MKSLLFGTAGIPNCTKGDTVEGIGDVKKLGLGAMELEFVRQVHIKKDKAPAIRQAASENCITLTCHGPYWINLNAADKKKLHASINYVLDSARIAHMCGGWSVCFHAAYYMKMEKPKAYESVKNSLKSIVSTLQNEGVKIWIRPEFAGKTSQWGGIEELVKASQEVDMVMPCIDFAHVYARSIGTANKYEDYAKILEYMEKHLGREALNNMHIHMEGIAYGNTGERRHTNLKESNINYKAVVKTWKDFGLKGVVISESPNIEEDALFLKKTYNSV